MPDAVIMRFSERSREIYERLLAHAASCSHCRPLTRGSQEPAWVINRLGCLTGVLITTEWIEEYARLHNAKERQALADLGQALGIKDKPWGAHG
jgi:hypothetical protein